MPYAMRESVEEELDELVAKGTVAPTEFAESCSSSQVHYVKKSFRSKFTEISNVAYFWKAQNMRNPKIYVYICTDACIAVNFQFQNGCRNTRISHFYCHRNILILCFHTYRIQNDTKK